MMTRRIAYLFVVTLLPLLALLLWIYRQTDAAGMPTVVIDAVLYDGYESGDDDEAVRIRNVSATAVDVTGWQLDDGAVANHTVISLTTELASGETIWLAKHGQAFARQFGFLPDFEVEDSLPSVPNLAGSWPGFANSGDQVLLWDAADVLIDCLAYENDSNSHCGGAWSGDAVQPFSSAGNFASDGQILYRRLNQATGQPVPDTNTAVDWAQSRDDVINGRKTRYPGWDLEQFFQTAKITETAVLTVAVAPDNAYLAVVNHINSAQTSIQIEVQTFENVAIADALVAAVNRGVSVDILLEGAPVGGIDDHEIYNCNRVDDAGGRCYVMVNDSDNDIFDRYAYIHAKFILIDNEIVIISSENLSPNSMPDDDKSDGTTGRRGVVLITDAPGVINHVQTVFDADLDMVNHVDIVDFQSLSLTLPVNFTPITITGGTSYTVRHLTPESFTGEFAFELVQSPENSLRDEDSLLGMINRAGADDTVLVQQLSERPYWGSSSSNASDDPSLRVEAYIEAARRGATVRLLLDEQFDDGGVTSNSATCDYVNTIADAEQIDLKCKTGNPTGLGIHNKMVLVQSNGRGYSHIGSINGTELSSKGNRELALQVQSDEIYAYLSSMFWQDWGFIVYLPITVKNTIPRADHLLISEVLYDPPGAVDDQEFIEIVNPTNATIDISNYSVSDAVDRDDFEDVRRFPEGTQIAPGQTIVVATAATSFFAEYNFQPDFEILDTDEAVPNMIDDPEWGDVSTFLRLGNQGDEVILRDEMDQVIDVLTYGTGSYPNNVSCPAITTAHSSLERLPYWRDSDDCPFDFREWPFPSPGMLP